MEFIKKLLHVKSFPRILFILLLAALAVRIALIGSTLEFGNNGDFVRYEDWARIAHINNYAATYVTPTRHSASFITPANNQTPGLIYILSGTYESWILSGKVIAHITHTAVGSIHIVNTYLQHFFMKLSPLITDLGMGILAYLFVAKKMGKKRGFLAMSLVLFNPVVFYNSAIWGQMDSLNNFFFLLSLFFIYRKNILFSMLAFTISLYIKLSLLPLLPFYLVFLFFIAKKDFKKILLGIILCTAAVVIATFPVSANPIFWLLTNIPIIAQGELQNITVAAFNFWWMVFCYPSVGHNNIPLVTQFFFGISLKIWAFALFGIFSIPFVYFQVKKSKEFISKHLIFLTLSIVALLAFLFLPGMHDRYMYPVFPLFAIAIAFAKNVKVYFVIFCFLTFFNLSNVVYSWYPFVIPSTSTFYHIFYGDTYGWIISILTVIVAIALYFRIFNEFKKI